MGFYRAKTLKSDTYLRRFQSSVSYRSSRHSGLNPYFFLRCQFTGLQGRRRFLFGILREKPDHFIQRHRIRQNPVDGTAFCEKLLFQPFRPVPKEIATRKRTDLIEVHENRTVLKNHSVLSGLCTSSHFFSVDHQFIIRRGIKTGCRHVFCSWSSSGSVSKQASIPNALNPSNSPWLITR